MYVCMYVCTHTRTIAHWNVYTVVKKHRELVLHLAVWFCGLWEYNPASDELDTIFIISVSSEKIKNKQACPNTTMIIVDSADVVCWSHASKWTKKAILIMQQGCRYQSFRAQDLFESRGGCPGLPVPNSLYGLCGRYIEGEEGTQYGFR